MNNKNYGWFYGKNGQIKTVIAPERAGKPVSRPRKTKTGKIPANVGFPGFKS